MLKEKKVEAAMGLWLEKNGALDFCVAQLMVDQASSWRQSDDGQGVAQVHVFAPDRLLRLPND
jgi:hypothetical protein